MFILVVAWLNDHRPLQRFTYTIGLAGIVLLLLPLVPGSAPRSSAPRSGSMSVPTASNPQRPLGLAGDRLASYLVEKRDVLALAGYRILGIDLPGPRPRPDPGDVADQPGHPWQRDLGTSLLFFGLFVMMLYVAGAERRAVLGTCCSRRGVLRLPQLRHVARVGAAGSLSNFDPTIR